MDIYHVTAVFFITLILYFMVNSTIWDKYILPSFGSNMINNLGSKSNTGVLTSGVIYSVVMTLTYGIFSNIKTSPPNQA